MEPTGLTEELYTHLERIEELRPGTAKRLKAQSFRRGKQLQRG